jgi:hypothetical protein
MLRSAWEIHFPDAEPQDVGEYLPDWDYLTELPLRRHVSLDWAKVTESLQCGDDVRLATVLRVGTGSGRLPRSIIHQARFELDRERTNALINLTLQGDRLSTVLDLTIDILLGQASYENGPLTPQRAGDRLWKETVRMRLEGEEPRFPIEVADFDALLGNSAAARSPWYLHWSPRDWSRDFHGSMRLYLNSDHKDLVARVESEDGDVLRSLMADVMGQVCEALVRDAEALTHLESCEEGSLGRQAKQWLHLAFPGADLDQAKAIIESRPGEFRAAFQAIAEIGGDE